MKFELDVLKFNADVVVTSGECCDFGCPNDMDQMQGKF